MAPGEEEKDTKRCEHCLLRGHTRNQCFKKKGLPALVQPNNTPPPGPAADSNVKLAVTEMSEAHTTYRKRHATPDTSDEKKLSKYSSTSRGSGEARAVSSENRKFGSAEYFAIVDRTVDLIMRDCVKTSRHCATKENRQRKKTDVTVCVEKIMANNTLLTDVRKIYHKYCEIYGRETARQESIRQSSSKVTKDSARHTEDEIFQGPYRASASARCKIQSALDTIVKNEINSKMTSQQIAEFKTRARHDVYKSLMGKPVPRIENILDMYYDFLYKDYYGPAKAERESSPKTNIEKIKSAAETIVRKYFLEKAGKLMQDFVERRLLEMFIGKSIDNSKLLIEEYEKKFGVDNLPVIIPDECTCQKNKRTPDKTTKIIFDGPENASVQTLHVIMRTAKLLCTSKDEGLSHLQVMLMSWIIRDRILTILNGHPILKDKDLANFYRTNFDEKSDAILVRKIRKINKAIESFSDLFKNYHDLNSSEMRTLELTENAMFREYIVQHHDIVEFHSLYLRRIIRIRIYDIAKECLKSHRNLNDLIRMYQTKYPLVNDEQLFRNCLHGKIEWKVWEEAKVVENCGSEEKTTEDVFLERVEELLQKVSLTSNPSSSEKSPCDGDAALREMLERKLKSMFPQLKEELLQEYSKNPSVFQDTSFSEPTKDISKEVGEREILDSCDPDVRTQCDFDKILTDIDQDLSELITAINEDG